MSSIDGRVRLAAIVAAAVLVADQATKAIVQAVMPHESFGPFFALTYVRNTGAAFGLLATYRPEIRLPLFFVVTVVAVGALVSFLRRTSPDHRWLVGALGGILGGALGNLICRVFRHGQVIDFLDVHWGEHHWPAFNVADSAITVGVAIVLLHSLRHGDQAEATRRYPEEA
jgi:signal peptidase II